MDFVVILNMLNNKRTRNKKLKNTITDITQRNTNINVDITQKANINVEFLDKFSSTSKTNLLYLCSTPYK